jgi:hypothetical protein
MRRLVLALWLSALVCPAYAADQYARYNGSCEQGGARVMTNGVQSQTFVEHSFPSCTVTVFIHATLTKATLFSDAAGTQPLLNPFTATSKGAASWYAPDARYDVQYSGGFPPNNITTPFTVSDIQLCFGCSGGGGGGNGNAITIQSVPVSTTPPTTNQFLGFNGSVWAPTAITGFLPLTGGSMTGPLSLFGAPLNPQDATPKTYVDSKLLAKADLISGIVPSSELGVGTATGNCLIGGAPNAWTACGVTFPVTAPDSSTVPQYSFTLHPELGMNVVLASNAYAIRSVQVAGSSGAQTITLIISTPIRPLSWTLGSTFQLASLPSSPTDLTSLNGNTYTVSTVTGGTPTSTLVFSAPTSIGVSTYTVSAGSASIWDVNMAGHSWTFSRLDSSSPNIAGHGSVRAALRDAWVSRNGSTGDFGIDNVLIRGSSQASPVNPVGTGRMTIDCSTPANCAQGATSLPIAKAAGSNWNAVANDVIEVAHSNVDAEKQDYIVTANTTVTAGTTTLVPISPFGGPGTGLSTSLTGGELAVAGYMQAQLGDASGTKTLGPATFLGDIQVYGNIYQLGPGAWQFSGVRQAGTSVTVASGKDFSLYVGSDNLFHCQLSTLLGGGSCGSGGGGGGGVTSVSVAVPTPAFTVSGNPITGSGTITIGYGAGQIPVANLGTGSGSSLAFLNGTGAFANAMTYTGTSTAFNGFTQGAAAGWGGYTALNSSVGGGSPQTLTLTSTSLSSAAPSTYTSGHIPSVDASIVMQDSGLLASNVLTNATNFTSGHIPKANGNKTLTEGYAVQGTDVNLLSSGTVAGVGATLCTDALGGATTSGCSSGSSAVQISGTPVANQVAVWTNATTIQGLTATGTLGSPVFSVSPTLVTPVLGVATATSINKVTITQPATGSTLTIADGKTLTASRSVTITASDDVSSLNITQATTAAAVFTTGDLISAAGNDRTLIDSGVVASNIVTATAGIASGHIPKSAGARSLTDGYTVQGTDTALLTSGTISGTLGATLCLDAQNGATTSGCTSGGSGNTTSTALTSGTYPVANGANSIIDGLLKQSGQILQWTGTGGISTGSSGTGQWTALEGTAPSGIAFQDIFWADSTTHRWNMKNNNSSADQVVGAATIDSFTNKTFNTGATGNVFQIAGLGITASTGNTNTLANASGVFTNGNLTQTDANHNLTDTGIIAANVPTSVSNFVNGQLIMGTSAGKTMGDSGVVAANVVTASAAFVNGHIPKASGATRILTDGYGVQGTDANLITSGTIAGVAVLVCTDANGGITTTGCPAGSTAAGGSNTQLQWNNASVLAGITQWTTNGTTTMTGGATGVLDLSAMAPASGLKLPSVAGAAPTADGFIGINLTTHALVSGSNGTTIVHAAAATGTNTSTTCTNQFVTVISSVAIPTCTTATLASAQFANQGTTTTVLHGNAAGNPSFGAIVTNDLAANAVTAAKSAVVLTYRVCDMAFGDTSASSALTNGQLGPQKRMCFIPAAATVVEVDVAADAGTPNIIVGRSRAGVTSNLVSSALATAGSGGIACSNTGGTTGLDGTTTCSATLQNTGTNAGDYFEAVSGTAGGTAKLMTVHIVYTVN